MRPKDGLERTTSLVVIEAGAPWPAFIEGQHHTHDRDVLSQQLDESSADFARRVVVRLRTLSSAKITVGLGILAAGMDRSESAVQNRYRIARALVEARAAQGAELVLVAAGREPRHDLFALAGLVCGGLSGTDLTVKVRTVDKPDPRASKSRHRHLAA
jgi:hypothetical protein